MKLVSLTFCFLVTAFTALSQNYAYSFEGELSTKQITELEAEIKNIKTVSSCKIKMKDAFKGQVYIEISPESQRAEGSSQFSPVDIKKLLISKDLMPLNFIELKEK